MLHTRDHSRQNLGEARSDLDEERALRELGTFFGDPRTDTPFTLCSKEAIPAVSERLLLHLPSSIYQRSALVNQTSARYLNQETGQCLLEATCCLTGSHKAHRTHYCLFQAFSSAAAAALFGLALDAKLSKFLLLCRLFSCVSWLLSGAAANRASKPVSLAETGFV